MHCYTNTAPVAFPDVVFRLYLSSRPVEVNSSMITDIRPTSSITVYSVGQNTTTASGKMYEKHHGEILLTV